MYLAYSCWSITIPVCARLRGRRFCSWCGQSNQFFVSHYYNPDSQPSESVWATSSRHFDSPDQPFSPVPCRSKDNNTVYASSSPPLTTGQPPWKSGTSNTGRRPRHHFIVWSSFRQYIAESWKAPLAVNAPSDETWYKACIDISANLSQVFPQAWLYRPMI